MTQQLPLVWSPGWSARVRLGTGLEYMRKQLEDVTARNPSHTWADVPQLRSFERSPGTAHRLVHRLAALGVIALQRRALGCHGGLRFTFGVRRFLWRPPRRAQVARMGVLVPQGQLELLPETPTKPPEIAKPPETAPPERPRTPENGDGGVRVQSEFQRGLARHGFAGWGQ